jgi:succinoglycan biosynthesis protein ExoA
MFNQFSTITISKLPSITVIMPLRNESAFIIHNLHAVLTQDYPSEKSEIIIADGMSNDNTRILVRDFSNLHPELKITVLDNPGMIVSTGMNIALRQARGEFIVRVDGHTLIAPDYLSQCVATITRTSAKNIGGRMNAIGSNPFGKAVAIATSSPFGVGNSKFHYSQNEEEVDSVYMGAWPREVFKEIGLFDEELVRNQDDEFNYRLREQGGRILLNPKIKSEYTVRSTPQSLWKQYFQYGFWKIRVLQKHPKQMSFRQFIPPVFVLTLLASIVFLVSISWGWIPFTLVASSYLFVNLLVSAILALKKDWKQLLRLPLVFSILHVSYGFGFFCGLFKFWNRWSDKIGQVPQY